MPAQTNLNRQPYFDDFSPDKNFYRVLYKAGFPIQARELTQSQSILQDQFEQFSSSFFADGDRIIPGEFALVNPANYVRLASITQNTRIEEYLGYKVTGATSGVIGRITHVESATLTDDATIYVAYENSGNDNLQNTFVEGEVLETDHPDNYTARVGITTVSKPVDSPVIGMGTLFKVTAGSYYVNGFAVRNTEQTIAIDKYGTTPTLEVGFNVIESFVNSVEDPSLLDNSQGSPNFAAPGADRLKIELILASAAYGEISSNFIKLATINQGNIVGKPDQTVKWKWLYDILAKRTFDESGNYIVRDFPIEPLEYWNDVEVDGVFDKDIVTDLYPPLPTSESNVDIDFDTADGYYALRVDPGLAYVQGYEVGLKHPMFVYGNKPRFTKFFENSLTQVLPGYSVEITNVFGHPDVQNIKSTGQSQAFDDIITFRNFTDGYVGTSRDEEGRPLNAGNAPWITYHIIFKRIENIIIEPPIIPVCAIRSDGDPIDEFIMITEQAGNIVVPDGICQSPGLETYDLVINNPQTVALSNTSRPFNTVSEYRIVSTEVNSMVITSPTPITRGDEFNDNIVMISTEVDPAPSGVIKPRYIQPGERIRSADGYFGYNSLYSLGVLTSTYFTELRTVPVSGTDEQFEVGSVIRGEESGALAVIETGSYNNVVIVSNVIGEFVPGEDIIQGNKVNRILNEGEVSGFQFYDAGNAGNTYSLEDEQGIILTSLGSSLELSVGDGDIVCTQDNITLTTQGERKVANFPYPEGSVEKTRVNIEVVTVPNAVKGYAVQLDYKISNSLSKTKAFYSPLDDVNDFSADLAINNKSTTEIFDLAEGSLFTGRATVNFLTCDNLGGDLSEELVAGDLITFIDDNGASNSKIVLFTTRATGYGINRSPSRVYFTTALNFNVTGKTIQRVRVRSSGNIEDTLLMQLPQSVVKSLETDNLRTGINYQIFKEFILDVPQGATEFALTTNRDNEVFIADRDQFTISVSRDILNPGSSVEGRHLTTDGIINSQDEGTKAIIKLSQPLASGCTLKVNAPIAVFDAQAKRKKANRASISIQQVDADKEIISLGYADVYSIEKISYRSGSETVDITDNFIFDNGQRANHYDISRLIRKAGTPPPQQNIQIILNYFEHLDEGDFFSVDSYVHSRGVSYDSVPVFLPQQTNVRSGDKSNVIQLRDAVDFRPIVNTTGNNPSVLATLVDNRDQQGALNFISSVTDGNAFVPRVPIPGSQFKCDIEYYVPKIDSLFLDKSGEFKIVSGLPSEAPVPPDDISTGIRLYDISLPAYTFSVKNTKIRKFNYRVYQMKDIADIHRRVDRVEELVALTMLEVAALNMSVRDDVTGLDRYKNGVVVDTFGSHSKGDVQSSQYRCSIDQEHTHLRSPFMSDQVGLEDSLMSPDSKLTRGYVEKDGVVLCQYTETDFQTNDYATKSIKVQPHPEANYFGAIHLDPSIDTWKDNTRDPFLVIDDNGIYDALQGKPQRSRFNSDFIMGTVWGEWETRSAVSSSNTQTNGRRGHNITRSEHQRREADFAFENAKVKNQSAAVDLYTSNQNWSSGLKIGDGLSGITEIKEQTKSPKSATTHIVATSMGDRVVNVALNSMMRTVAVRFKATNLKPKTQHRAFFDGVEVGAWVSPDKVSSNYPDGKLRFVGTPGSSNDGFGKDLVSDEDGILQGIFLIPNGRAPVNKSLFVTLDSVNYQTSGPTRSFPTGAREFMLHADESSATSTFSSSTVINDNNEFIVSTRPNEDVTGQGAFDPTVQTFMIDPMEAPEGVFVTSMDVFFEEKDPNLGIEGYLVSTDGESPTNTIIPHSRVFKCSSSIIRVICELSSLSPNTSEILDSGIVVSGETSGARGVVKSAVTFESQAQNVFKNVNNSVYDIILENYSGEFIPGEILVPQVSPPSGSTFKIAHNEVTVTRVDLRHNGNGYDYNVDTIEFESPQLPGGVAATAEMVVDNNTGISEVKLISAGSGYTKVPSVTIISSTGTEAKVMARTIDGRKAVEMGVATSSDATAETRFRFKAPVYLMGGVTYGFALKSGGSNKYKVWTAKVGDNQVESNTKVVAGHGTGPIYLSKNSGPLREERNMAMKYKLHRAKFVTDTIASLILQNEPLGFDKLKRDPIETSNRGTFDTAPIWKLNPSVVKVHKKSHGHVKGDQVILRGITNGPGGIPNEAFNQTHTVLEADIDFFLIEIKGYKADVSETAGGEFGMISSQRPYEVLNVSSGAMNFPSSGLYYRARTSNYKSMTGFNEVRVYTPDESREIHPDSSLYLSGPRVLGSYVNESNFSGTTFLSGRRSLEVAVELTTASEYVSPVIDTQRTNATVIRNLINNPTPMDPSYGAGKISITADQRFYNNTNIEVGDSISFDYRGGKRNVLVDYINPTVGKISLLGATTEELPEINLLTPNDFRNLGTLKAVQSNNIDYYDEGTNFGSTYSKWLSRLFILENPCDGIQVKLSCIFYDTDDIKVYYRPRAIGFDSDIAEINWIPFNADGTPDNVSQIEPRSAKSVDPDLIMSSDWQSVTWSVQDTAKFDAVAIKIVMKTDNPAYAPLIDDMQLIATE